MRSSSTAAPVFITFVVVTGFTVLGFGLLQWQLGDTARFACYALLALLASGLKVNLPGVTGTMSVIFLFLLIGMLELSLTETMLISCMGTLVQCFWHSKARPRLVQVLFNVACMATAASAAYHVYHSRLAGSIGNNLPLLLGIATTVFFLFNTIPVAFVISLTEGKSVKKVWSECYFWSFPYYLVGAAIAGLASLVNRQAGWQSSLFVLPVTYFIYRSYHLYLDRLEGEKKHAEEMASLHLRTIEALALAIEAKDHSTREHLERVQVYAVEMAKELGLPETELEAVRAAAVLHDIGKLAVPEYIISKPGKLTREEFEKMKIHPVVGAEILERVRFPYPVVPIVRAHHEKWDGSGYPCGLKGEQIPIGARILSAVDCLDALATDRQYRRALPLDKAMEMVEAEAGRSFDPKIVDVLRRRYVELEALVKAKAVESFRLSTNIEIRNGKAPDAGFATAAAPAQSAATTSTDFLGLIAAARQEVQNLYELCQTLGNSLRLDETLSLLSIRLKRMIPFDAMAVYVRGEDRLVPEFVCGDDFRLFASLRIPLGEGVSGWVAENGKPMLNGNPSVEPGYLNDPTKFSTLRSALAVPLEGSSGVLGVLTLYDADADAFTADHLRVLLAISSKVALAVENAVKYRMAESTATTDFLTGLPNARSLFLHLDSELARCRRNDAGLAVLVCDLDGFKQINDQFGHLEGNRVLRVLASKLKASCREYDYVARMGGDEFVLVLPGIEPGALREKAARLSRLAQETGREVCGEGTLSTSVGCAFFPENGTDAEQLLAEADRQMYAEKQHQHNALRNISRRIDLCTSPFSIN